MSRWRFSAVVVVALCLSLAGVGAQQPAQQQPSTAQPPPQEPAPQQPQQPVFRAGATLVRVDVTVVDRDGEPVNTLTKDDFEVEEDGVLQTVEALQFVSANGQPMRGDNDSLTIRSREHAAAEAARDEMRVFVIFWDEYHIDQFASAIRGREILGQFVATAFGPTDLVALMDPLTPIDALEFTRDRDALAQKTRKLSGRLGLYFPPRSAAEEAMLERGDAPRLRTEVTLSALKSAAVHLGGLREGRKSILFVSEGFPLRSEAQLMLQDLIQSANDANTAIYTLDPQGLGAGVASMLRSLAENTGAEAIVNSNSPTGALKQLVTDSSGFYYLGYAPTRALLDDGKFHEIKVRVKRSRLDVRARHGYWAPSAEDVERIAKESAAPAAPTEASKALASITTLRQDRTLDVWVGIARTLSGGAEVSVAWVPRPGQLGGMKDGTVAVSVQGPGGKGTYEALWETDRLSFRAASPGPLQLKISARNAAGDVMTEESRTITVPDFQSTPLAISTPILFRAQNVAELRQLRAAGDPAPFAGREFVRTDRLLIRFAVYGDPQATVTTRLLTRDQQSLATLPVTPLPGDARAYQIDLPLASVARGEYLLSIEAAVNEERATALVPLRVGS